MATDVYGRRKMYSGGGILLLLIPIGMIIIFYLYDFCVNIYTQNKLDRETKEVLLEVLNRDGLESVDEARELAEKLFMEYEVEEDDISLLELEDNTLLLTVYDRYTSVVGTLSFGVFRNKQIMVHSSYRGSYNEYREAVVEKYNEGEDTKESNPNFDDTDEVIIK